MARITSRLKTVTHTVLTFDICSSSDILQNLINTEDTKDWRDLLIQMENFLARRSNRFEFDLYKFTGDGWILLFDYDCSGSKMFDFITKLSRYFDRKMTTLADDLLEVTPDVLGLTFGIDRGKLIRFGLDENIEYVGRPINIACRLQSSIKDKDKQPQYKVLMTKKVYQQVKEDIKQYRHTKATRILHNIAGGKRFHCIKVWLNI